MVIHGDVQGIFFRDFVRRAAGALNLTGWVRNNPEGTVEVTAEGTKEHLNELLSKCQHGPPPARVTAIDATWGKEKKEFTTFEIRH